MSNDKEAIDRLFKLQAKINMMVVDGTCDAESLADALQAILEEKRRRLTTLTSLTVASNTTNPHDFFKTRKGLWTSSSFNKFILSDASKKEVSADETTIGSAGLAQAADDAEIGRELPEGYVFEDVDTLLVRLATLIESQWGGKEGTLLNNGYANIFYVKVNGEVFAVHVYWRSGYRRWSVNCDLVDAYLWHAGRRVFSATAA